ncbi:MAG: ClpX C4-type zinc finger protein [Solirubrobacteraceae bacterium]
MADGEDDRREGPARAIVDLDQLRCSFCGKHRGDVDAIGCGPTPAVAICNECVGLCAEVIAESS